VSLIWALSDAKVSLPEITIESWLAIAYLVFVANALAYFSWFRVVAVFPAAVSGIGAMAVPVVGVLASAWLLDERIGWREWTALSLIVCALAVNLASTLHRRPA
jgi:drug/metabolite transporter (DMT)-like permease